MKKVNDEMPEEYDFSGKKGVRGKYAKAFKKGHSVRVYDKDKLISDKFFASIDSDVREYFTDSKSINKALRTIISIIPSKTGTATK
ncbi:MAG: hypothetical protein HOP17_13065 [Acidobacteria bacterium]|nr:hypothetical protein [Acidobacteriota bacterium]